MKWSDRAEWGDIPEHMRGGVMRYIEEGIPPGHFLQAVFANDLLEACARADAENLALIHCYAKLLWSQCPRACFGSPVLVRNWIGRGGINGNDKHEPLPVSQWSRWADQEHGE